MGELINILYEGFPLTHYRIAKEIGLVNTLLFLARDVKDVKIDNAIKDFCIKAAKRISWAVQLEGSLYSEIREFAEEARY